MTADARTRPRRPCRDIGVAIGIPEPYGRELQGWRERLGDPNAKRIVPHVTLLPPTDGRTTGRCPRSRSTCARSPRMRTTFEIMLRGSATFLPVSPVVFVPLVQGISECERLEEKVRRGRWTASVRFPYHPHVTVAHDLPPDALRAGLRAQFAATRRASGSGGSRCSSRTWTAPGGRSATSSSAVAACPGPEEAPADRRRLVTRMVTLPAPGRASGMEALLRRLDGWQRTRSWAGFPVCGGQEVR